MAQDPLQSVHQGDDSSSEVDYFVPTQDFGSSDDERIAPAIMKVEPPEIKPEIVEDESREEDVPSDSPRDDISVEERPDSSMEDPSQSSSQENHEIEAANQVDSGGVSIDLPITAEPAPPVKTKNRRNRKKMKKAGKGAKEKPKKYDEMRLMDEFIEQNKKIQVNVLKPVIDEKKEQEKKSELEALRLKLRDRKAKCNAAKTPVIRMVQTKTPSIREQIDDGLQRKKAAIAKSKKNGKVSTDGKLRAGDLLDLHQKVTNIGGQQFPVQANSFSINPDNRTEILRAKYEDMIAAGKMTVEEAIDLIFQGKDITQSASELGAFDDDEEKRRQTEYYYKMIAQMDPMSKNRFKSNIPDLIKSISNEFVDHSIDEHGYIDMLHTIAKVERNINGDVDPEDSINAGAWNSMCRIFYEKFRDKMQLNTPVPITDPVLYYQEALKSYVAQMMINDLDRLEQSGVFKRYDPKVRPLILCCFQKHVADLFPSTEIVLDMNKVIEAGFAPRKALTFSPFGPESTIVAFGLFWSFSCAFSLFANFYRSPDGSFRYFWIIFDRINQTVDSILEPPRRVYHETVTESVEDGKTTLKYEHQTIAIEEGSSAQLEASMTVDAESVLDYSFMHDVSDTMERVPEFPIQIANAALAKIEEVEAELMQIEGTDESKDPMTITEGQTSEQ